MNVKEEKRGNVTLLVPEGRLDSNTSPAFEKVVMGHIDAGSTRLAIDFAELDYISSAGLRILLMAAKRIKAAGGVLALGGMKTHIREVFEISGFLSILTVLEDAHAAVEAAAA